MKYFLYLVQGVLFIRGDIFCVVPSFMKHWLSRHTCYNSGIFSHEMIHPFTSFCIKFTLEKAANTKMSLSACVLRYR